MIHGFNRFELKYVLHSFAADRFLDEVTPFLRPDPHGGSSGFYPVVSLYYDSPDLRLFRSKQEGIRFRRKLRLRIYPDPDPASVTDAMVEIKQRVDRTLQKRRLPLPLDDARRLCAGEASPEDPVASEVIYMVKAMGLRPTCITAYQRRAFLGGRLDHGLRVTVDSNLMARCHALDVTLPARNHRFLPGQFCILEIKFDDRIPRWLASRIRAHHLDLQRVSKYCSGVARTHPFALSA